MTANERDHEELKRLQKPCASALNRKAEDGQPCEYEEF